MFSFSQLPSDASGAGLEVALVQPLSASASSTDSAAAASTPSPSAPASFPPVDPATQRLLLSIGVRSAEDDRTIVIVPHGTVVPATNRTLLLTTSVADQAQVTLRVLLGNHGRASRNTRIGTLILKGIEGRGRGLSQILVRVDVRGTRCVFCSQRGSGWTAPTMDRP